ncbi:MAG: peptide ABC transporter substrate-binding protein [Candidatus Limnocylindria bacterium]
MTIAACGETPPGGGQATTPPGGTGAATTRGQGDELVLLWWQGATILNPHLAQGTKDFDASRVVLEPLASMGPDGVPVANLAEEIPTAENGGVSDDQLTITWKLKTGVKWADGSDFTADDVVFTYEYMSNTEVAATTAAAAANIASVEAVDDTTVRVTFNEPVSDPYTLFVGPEGMILQRAQFADFAGANAKDAPGNQDPIGTGPYKVREFRPNDVVIYEINEQYREPNKPFFKTVQFKAVADATQAARAVFQTGDADYAWNLQVQASVLRQLVDTGGQGDLVTADSPNVERLLLQRANNRLSGDDRAEPGTEHPFLSDIRVRQALAMASNRKAVADQLYGSGVTGVETCNVITTPPDNVSPNTAGMDVCKYDLSAANALLDEAGWVRGADGFRSKDGVPLEVVYQTTVNPVRQATQDIIKADWESIGVRVELKSVDAGVFFSSDVANPDTAAKFFADVEMFTNGSASPNMQDYLAIYRCDSIAERSNQWRGDNYMRWCSEEYDALFDQLAAETDPDERARLIIEMNDLMVQEVVEISLVARKFPVAGKAKDLQGTTANPWDSDLWNIADWRK